MVRELDTIRTAVDLNGAWEMREDLTEKGFYCLDASGFPLWRPVTLPADIAACIPERPYDVGVFWFRRRIHIPGTYSNRRTVLHFDGVNHEASVFIDSRFVCKSNQGYLPFEADITNAVKPGCDVELCIRVDTRRHPGELPTSFFWKNSAGIIRDTCLYATNKSHISDVCIRADHTGNAAFYTDICAERSDLTLSISVIDGMEKEILYAETAVRAKTVHMDTKADIIPWTMDNPALYTALVSLKDGDQVIDRMKVTFGYRTICAKDGKLLLNGEEVFLRGFNRHEDHPACGGAANEAVVEADFAMMKEAGANFVRMCHYPHDARELEVADRLGLALLVEIPLCGYNGTALGIVDTGKKPFNEEVYANAREQLLRMIRRDRNHPSVLIWSVSNENEEPLEEIIRNQDALIRIAKEADPTRLVTHVSNHSRHKERKSFFREDDVICFNTYRTIFGRIANKNRDFDPAEAGDAIAQTVEGLRKDFPDKPVIVTEFGYRTCNSFDGPEDEDIQAAAVAAEYVGARRSANGASVWLFADHLWPKDNGLAGEVSEYGLLRRDRTEKKAYQVYSDLLKKG